MFFFNYTAATDIYTRDRLGVLGEPAARARRRRKQDRARLWQAFREAGVTTGARPGTENPGRALDAALGFVADTPARLALFPLEDALGLAEQPNVPGTIDQHPNWRRRIAPAATDMLDLPDVAARLAIVDRYRKQ